MRTCQGLLAAILVLAGANSLQAQSYTPFFLPSRPTPAPVAQPGISSIFSATMLNQPSKLSLMQHPFKATNGSLGRFLPSLPTMNPQNLMLGRSNGAPSPTSQIISTYPSTPRFVPVNPGGINSHGSSWLPW